MRVVLDIGHEWNFEGLPRQTIALDGACPGPRIDPEGRRYSFDHHGGCVRLATAATCQQVLDALLLGFDPTGFTTLLNDVDGDSVLSVWLLQNAHRWRAPDERERVRPLVAAVSGSDAHGPAFPTPFPGHARHFFLVVLEPLRRARRPWPKERATELLDACLANLEVWWTAGLVPSPPPMPVFESPRLECHGSWVLADAGEVRPESRVAGAPWLYEHGYDRVVLASRLPNDRYRYTLARRSDLVSGFPLDRLYATLNEVEAAARGVELASGQRWGGASSVGGSPRDGSVLAPDRVAATIDGVLKGQAEAKEDLRGP